MIDMQGQVMDYQDLNFKLYLPTAKAGVFSVWGTGDIDRFHTGRLRLQPREHRRTDTRALLHRHQAHQLHWHKEFLRLRIRLSRGHVQAYDIQLLPAQRQL